MKSNSTGINIIWLNMIGIEIKYWNLIWHLDAANWLSLHCYRIMQSLISMIQFFITCPWYPGPKFCVAESRNTSSDASDHVGDECGSSCHCSNHLYGQGREHDSKTQAFWYIGILSGILSRIISKYSSKKCLKKLLDHGNMYGFIEFISECQIFLQLIT